MQGGEAEEVSGLIYRVYRDTFPEKYLYDPARIREMSTQSDRSSVVACDGDGQVIGYAALRPYSGYPEIGCITTLSVAPEWRNRGIGEQLAKFMARNGSDRNYFCIAASAPTAYAYPQRILNRQEFVPTVFLPGAIAEGLAFMDLTGKLRHRESLYICTKMNVNPEYGPQYLPPEYARLIMDIGAALGIRLMSGSGGYLPLAPTEAGHATDAEWRTGYLWLRSIGPDYRDVIYEQVHQFIRSGTQTIRLHIDLGDPGAPAAAASAQRNGFFFAGVLPSRTGLILIMEHLEKTRVATQRLHARSPMAKRLRAEYQSRFDP
jgi:GNAT superfamily N-acetyltransferase